MFDKWHFTSSMSKVALKNNSEGRVQTKVWLQMGLAPLRTNYERSLRACNSHGTCRNNHLWELNQRVYQYTLRCLVAAQETVRWRRSVEAQADGWSSVVDWQGSFLCNSDGQFRRETRHLEEMKAMVVVMVLTYWCPRRFAASWIYPYCARFKILMCWFGRFVPKANCGRCMAEENRNELKL